MTERECGSMSMVDRVECTLFNERKATEVRRAILKGMDVSLRGTLVGLWCCMWWRECVGVVATAQGSSVSGSRSGLFRVCGLGMSGKVRLKG